MASPRLIFLLVSLLASRALAEPEIFLGRAGGQVIFELAFDHPPRVSDRGRSMLPGFFLEVATDLEYPMGAVVEAGGPIRITVSDFAADGGSARPRFLLSGTLSRDGRISGTWERAGTGTGRAPFHASREPLLVGSRAKVEPTHRETKKRFPSTTRVRRSCGLTLDELLLPESEPSAKVLNALLQRRARARLAPYLGRVTRCASPGATLTASVGGPSFLSDSLASVPLEWQFTVHRRPERLPPDDQPTDTPDYSWEPVTIEGAGAINVDLRSGRELDVAALLGSRPAARDLLALLVRRAARRRAAVKAAIAALQIHGRSVRARLDGKRDGDEAVELSISQRQLKRLASPSSPLGRALPP